MKSFVIVGFFSNRKNLSTYVVLNESNDLTLVGTLCFWTCVLYKWSD